MYDNRRNCFSEGAATAVRTVTAGDHKLSGYEGMEQTARIKEVYNHPQYDRDSLDNDISLLELAVPLAFTAAVQPICLASSTPPAGTELMAAGWGATPGR